MIGNYIRVAARHLRRNRLQTTINVFGLSIGFGCCLLIALYVNDELNYDRFHEKSDRIYRISSHSKIGDNERHWSLVPSSVAPAVIAQLPAIETHARISTLSKAQQTITYGDQLYDASLGIAPYGRAFYADSTIFDVFTWELTGAQGTEALGSPNSVVITRKVAKKIFGDKEAIGETLEFSNLGNYRVTAIVEEVPSNSHLQFDYLLSTDFTRSNNPGGFVWVRSYIVLTRGTGPEEIEARVDTIGRASQPSMAQNGIHMDYFLQSVKDIHLTSGLEYEVYPVSDIRYVYILLLISGFILVIATINFINLSTAQIGQRAKEVGIRKVMGAENKQMLLQFFIQSFLISALSLLVAGFFLAFTFEWFTQFTGKELSLLTLLRPASLLGILSAVVVISLIAGLYPAVIVNRFNPILAIKENVTPGSSSQFLRKILVVFQFCISVILIVATYTIVQQLHFLRSKGLGFNPEKIVTMPIDGNLSYQKLNTFKRELLSLNGIVGASLSTGAPALNTNVIVMLPEGNEKSNTRRVDGIYADFDFIRTYDLPLIAGRLFNHALAADSLNFILNRSAVEKFGWTMETAVGKKVHYPQNTPGQNEPGYVIGVIEDVHYQALHNAIGPLMIGIHSSNFNVIGFRHLSLRVSTTNMGSTIEQVEAVWKEMLPGTPFSYSFLDTVFHQKYESEERLSKIISAFAALAIAIACLGLLGLASFLVQQKTKEIGIRKVLGATFMNIWSGLSRSLILLILLGNFIAWPLAYYFLEMWLSEFAYRIDIGIQVFILAGLSSVFTAVLTIGYKTAKASLADPVKSIRYE